MNFEREKKINRLLLHTARIHNRFKDGFLKVPIEMIEFAFREAKLTEAGTYLTCQLIYSGKVPISDKPANRIASELSVSPRTVYRSFKWLIDRDWIGKDKKNGWIFFRGIDFVHEMEGFKYSKSALMFRKDLSEYKAFFIGAILSNFIGNKGAGTEQKRRCSAQSGFPVSLSIVQKLFDVSEKTAFSYRKLAQKHGFIKMYPNLREVTGITPNDVVHLKQNDITRIELPLFGTKESISVFPKQLRVDRGFIFAQLPNLIKPKVLIGHRNMNRSKPYTPSGLC